MYSNCITCTVRLFKGILEAKVLNNILKTNLIHKLSSVIARKIHSCDKED